MNYNTEEEVWKDVKGYEGLYEVSNLGRIKSLRAKIVMKDYIDRYGYKLIGLYKEGKSKSFRVHRLVVEAFKGIPETMEVNHKDYNRTNNRLSNLEVVTTDENNAYSLENVLKAHKRETRTHTGNAKITADDVHEIRSLYKTGKYTQKELGKEYGIKRSAVGDIVNYKSWTTI